MVSIPEGSVKGQVVPHVLTRLPGETLFFLPAGGQTAAQPLWD